VTSDYLSRGARPSRLVICLCVDRSGPWWTGSLWRTSPLSSELIDVRVVMMIIRVLVMELLCQAVTGQIAALEYLLLGTRGHKWPCLVLSGIKWPCYLRTLTLQSLAQYW
jgi:hypothetical protein